jgi:hypothetical protein
MLQVFGEDVRVVVNQDFSALPEREQRRVLGLCRDTLALAGGQAARPGERWIGAEPGPLAGKKTARVRHG